MGVIWDKINELLQKIFHPINDFLAGLPYWSARLCAVLLFASAIFIVFFLLRKEYVNLDQPKSGILYDLRLWTVLALLPHFILYLYF